ncbi:hypothetical protein ACS0TY_014441 [Phlomoides rotata]
MAYRGFEKNSGPGSTPRAQNPFENSPRPPQSSPRPVSPRSSIDYRDLDASEGIFSPPLDSSRPFPGTRRPPYAARSPPLGFQNNQHVAGQHPHREEVQQSSFSPVWINQSKLSSHNNTPPAQQGYSPVLATGGTHHSGQVFQTKHADGSLPKRTRSPTFLSTSGASPENTRSDGHKRSLIDYRDLDAPEGLSSPPLAFESSSFRREYSRPSASTQNMFADQSEPSINYTSPLVHDDMPTALTTRDTYQSRRKLEMEHASVQPPKRARSPTIIPPINSGSPQHPAIVSDGPKRAPGFQSRSQSPSSWQVDGAEAATNKPMEFPAVKRTKIPLQSSLDIVSEENMDPTQEIERELQAKAKRLARFKDELSQPVQSHSTVKNLKDPAKRQLVDSKMDTLVDSAGGNVSSDYEGVASSSSIVGLCPDMCPEPERAERERKGDLDQYERVDGDRNLTSEFLAVKKYTRTAEREPELIRPMPILQKSMDYLLNLLDGPYDDRFLGLYNFLWDRMRAIRMDLRMQHIFNLAAIRLLEQMIRLHVIAMHELCEYTKGEGFSEGFDAHLNIEQMNKTSVELFQLYDDHRKKGIRVPSEREFRGYYALLKLDKHPGYKVEPAELSLDLAKMTPEMRQTPEVLFARDVARACRTGNFIAFFRLARKASYLQACLMHAHFSKLRTQALASLHCGLQINQGIPITQVAKWLGMEEENIEEVLEYYGFSVKDFEEPYMVKENAFLNVDNDFPVKHSELVERKRSTMIVADVSYPSLTESYADDEKKEFQLKKDAEPRPTPPRSIVPISTPQLHDEEMNDSVTSLSPKSSIQRPLHKASFFPATPDNRMVGVEVQEVPSGPFVPDFFNTVSEHHQIGIESAKTPMLESAFRNSFSRLRKHDLETTVAVTQSTAEEKGDPVMPLDSVAYTPSPQPMSTEEDIGDELTEIVEEDILDEVTTSNYDKEVVEAKLKLILRIWKRCTTKKRILRENKQFTANAALNLLSLGPPMWQLEEQPSNFGTFNIDHIMSQRHEVQERSYSVLNPSDVIATKLVEKNPDAKCLCWKLVLCSQEETLQNEAALSAWLHSKLIPVNDDGADDLLASSPGLAVWRSWISTLSDDVNLTCCLSVIKSTKLEDVNKSLTGANAVLFLLSDRIPLELQKKRLHDLVTLLPSDSRLPILILTGSCKDNSDLSNIQRVLELHNIDKSRVIMSFTFLKDPETKEMDGFFSDERLRDGLEWLACESPPQIVVSRTKTRERVLSHLNSTLEILDQMDSHRVHPNHCISAFNESLDLFMKEVAETSHANPTGWPCPEIDLLKESSNEHRAVTWYLPSVGWSSSSRIKSLMSELNDSKLPGFEDDLSWLSTGLSFDDDIGKLKSRLENCLVDYLTEASRMMRRASAQNEAGIMLQSCTLLELRNTTYYITPRWVPIFRRIFSWRLMRLNSGEASSMYLLSQHFSATPSCEVPFLTPYVVQPSFDELVEAGCFPTGLESNDTKHEASDVPMSKGNVVSMESEETRLQDGVLTIYDHSGKEKTSRPMVVRAARARTDTDKLIKLLEKCNIVQNQIDEKLSIYF